MISKPLYKRTSTGAIQQWQIEVVGDQYRTISGQVGGKLTTSNWKTAKAKNVGRSNEVNEEEQAQLIADRMIQKKLEGHYFRDTKSVDKVRFVKPMLAHGYNEKTKAKIKYAYSQPKLDGIRCIINREGMWSRNGKPLVSAPHIFEALQPMFQDYPDLILDGELYADALREDFDSICSLAKKTKPTQADLEESAEKLEYWVYDIADESTAFWERIDLLFTLIDEYRPRAVVPVTTHGPIDDEKIDSLYGAYLEAGLEGQMIRDGDAKYQPKRSTALLKRKEFQDSEAVILKVVEGVGNWEGYAKALTCRLKDGTIFNAGIKGNFEYCRMLLEKADFIVGCEATIRYQNLTPAGVPRFPVCHHIWEGKRTL